MKRRHLEKTLCILLDAIGLLILVSVAYGSVKLGLKLGLWMGGRV